ncbi:serine hydrolase [Nakamurella leprariae]|uniref:Serine hydrolase n=1 Tax=Nakamurella leprariae TaxID=2803911 RepID=A0A939BZK6_9ACTN|nr:serine hydrolase [Nakamurella leprariae]MBM9467801.1 serine hydrolase [Nakamurella leprariae]
MERRMPYAAAARTVRPRRRTVPFVGALTAAGLVLAGCAGADPETPATSTTSPASSAPTSSSPAATTSAPTSTSTSATGAPDSTLPAGPLGEAAAWVLPLLEPGGADLTEAQATERFTPEFLTQAPIAQLNPILGQFRAFGPWTVSEVQEQSRTAAVLVLTSDTSPPLALSISVDDAGLIDGLLFQPHVERDPATSLGALQAEVDGLGTETSLLALPITDAASCDTDPGAAGLALRVDEARPMGSIFKLYVLGAVVDAVAAGTLSWEETLTLSDDVRSLPSGQLQNEPTGTPVTVQDAAAGMIAISDNTATDLLIQRLGRPAVEQAMADLGMADPAANRPLLTTRNLFQLGWGTPDRTPEWVAADEAGRRALLDGLPGGPLAIDPLTVTTVVWPDGLEWFATARDICRAHLALSDRAGTPAGEPLTEILTANPGGIDPAQWPSVAFKGGNSPGVVAGSWLATDADGERFLVVFQTASTDPGAVPLEPQLVGVAQDALTLLAG